MVARAARTRISLRLRRIMAGRYCPPDLVGRGFARIRNESVVVTDEGLNPGFTHDTPSGGG
jgi:hypothetical protein